MPADNNTPIRVHQEQGIVRRDTKTGFTYEIRVEYKDARGVWKGRWRTVGSDLRVARRELARAHVAAADGELKPAHVYRLTVAEALVERFLPDQRRRVDIDHTLHRSTYRKYPEYVNGKIIPIIGHVPLSALTTGQWEDCLRALRVGGANPVAGVGRPRGHGPEVYEAIPAKKAQGWSAQQIAEWLTAAFPESCPAMTRHSVAAIERRLRNPPATTPTPQGLAVATVDNVHNMMRSAWKMFVRHDLVSRDRARIIAEASVPTRDRNVVEQPKVLWTAAQYCDFFDWCDETNRRGWQAWFFSAMSADRKSANLGLRWDDVDLDARVASLSCFVKNGDRDTRVLIEVAGKTTAGHDIVLDERTVEVLRRHRQVQAEELSVRHDRHACDTMERNCPLPGYHDRGLVFPQSDGNYQDPNKFLLHFKAAAVAYNAAHPERPVPVIDLHALRHGWNTIARINGVSDVVRMQRMDQTTLSANLAYSHVPIDAQITAAEEVSDLIFGNSRRFGRDTS